MVNKSNYQDYLFVIDTFYGDTLYGEIKLKTYNWLFSLCYEDRYILVDFKYGNTLEYNSNELSFDDFILKLKLEGYTPILKSKLLEVENEK